MFSRVLQRLITRNIRNLATEEQKMTTAAILVIGDEILKGEVADSNSTFLARELHKLGLKLKKISVVADDLIDIRDEIRIFSQKYDYVITTGGIGPTHDDVTYEGVALAFNEPLYLNEDLKKICMEFYKIPSSSLSSSPEEAGLKLAYIPKSSRLHYKTITDGNLAYPNVSVKNVYMFPGIPELLQRTVLEVGPILFKSPNKFFTKCCYCTLPEHKIVSELQQVVEEFPEVQVGCYPKMYNSLYKVKVTVESCNEETTERAYLRLIQLIPSNSIVNNIDEIS